MALTDDEERELVRRYKEDRMKLMAERADRDWTIKALRQSLADMIVSLLQIKVLDPVQRQVVEHAQSLLYATHSPAALSREVINHGCGTVTVVTPTARTVVHPGETGQVDAPRCGWQPAETAPKDGSVIVWDAATKRALVVPADDVNSPYAQYLENPTHWMPVPAPPKVD